LLEKIRYSPFIRRIEKIIPLYAILPLVTCFMWNCIVYSGTRLFTQDKRHWDMTTQFDRITPVIPIFVVVYFGCYLSWIVFYIANVRVGRKECAKFVTFDLLTRTICGIIFLVLPTTNVRPDVVGIDVFSAILRFLYRIDAADNLFPSIHCLVSWNCFVGIRNLKQYSKKWKICACIIAVLVFMSTLFTKQHVVADVIIAVVLSELVWMFVNHSETASYVNAFFEWIHMRIHRLLEE